MSALGAHHVQLNGSAWLVVAFWAGVIAFLILRVFRNSPKGKK